MPFANKPVLWLLLVIPPLMLAFFWWAWRTRERLLTQFVPARLLGSLTVGISAGRKKFRLACLLGAVVFLLLALARPQWGFDWQETKQRGLDIVVAIDTSKSMLAEDIAPNRLARAKLAALELMQQAKSDRLGLVAFAGRAFLQCPLTIDDGAFRQSVDALDVNVIPEGGTALTAAIETAMTAFKEGENYKTMVLFSDGEDQDSGALEAAKKAAEAGLRIFTIGIGSTEGELLRVSDAKGRTDYIRDDQGNVVKSRLNETLLREIATETKGFYLPLRGAKTIDTLYTQGLAPLPKSEASEKLVRQYHERYHWPLAAAIVLLLIEMLVPERSRESKARPAGAASPKAGLKPAAAAVGLLVGWSLAATASPSSALREYQAGKYDQSLKEYERLLEKRGEDPRLHYNAGAAAYRNRNYEEAAKQFNEALNSPDLNLQSRAYYNRGNSLYHLGDAIPDPKAKKGAWEKSLKDYESARKLNPQDVDAKFNYDFVKKMLQELQPQQQQQNQDKSDKDENQDQQKQDQQKQDQQQQNKDQKDQENKDSKQDQKDQEQKKQDSQKDQQDQKDQQAQQQKQDEQKQQQAKQSQDQQDKDKKEQEAKQASAKPGEKSDDKDDKENAENQQAYALGQMTPEQARQLLDAQKGDEKLMPVKPDGKPPERRPIKDW